MQVSFLVLLPFAIRTQLNQDFFHRARTVQVDWRTRVSLSILSYFLGSNMKRLELEDL